MIGSRIHHFIQHCYARFLKESNNPDDRELLIHKNYFSQKDIEICLKFEITSLEKHKNYEMIRELHNTLLAKIRKMSRPI